MVSEKVEDVYCRLVEWIREMKKSKGNNSVKILGSKASYKLPKKLLFPCLAARFGHHVACSC